MAVRTVAEPSRNQAWTAALPFLVAAVVYLVLLAVGASLLNDPDIFWHVVVGNWIGAHGFPTGDPFSFTFAGEPWIAKEWASQIVFSLAYRLGGWPAVVVVAAAAVALAFALLTHFLLDGLAPLPVIAFLAVAFVLAAPHIVARPHVLALPVMVAWVGGLFRAVDRDTPPPYALAALMVVWANLHGGFTLGVVLCVAAALDAVFGAQRGSGFRLARGWIGFVVLTVVAAMATPYGPRSMLVTWRILSQSEALSLISEWRPADFSRIAAFEVVLLAGVGLALYTGFVLRPVRILVILGLLHLALSLQRNGEVLGMVAPLVLAGPIARQFPALRSEREPGAPRWGPALGAAALLGAATVAAVMTVGYRPGQLITPAGAVEAIKRVEAGPVLNSYNFGGYLVFAGVPPFIDGRTELYGGAFTARHHRAVTLADLDDFLKLLDQYGIGATLLTPGTPALALLDRLPEWRRLYADDVAVAHIRVPRELLDAH